jgi:hypothetical protein
MSQGFLYVITVKTSYIITIMSNDQTDSQPLPTEYSESKLSVTAVIISECPEILKSDFLLRLDKGIKTYGTPLQPFNNRDAVTDLYEEVLDACQYAKQCGLEDPESIIFKCLYDGLICQAQIIKDVLLS